MLIVPAGTPVAMRVTARPYLFLRAQPGTSGAIIVEMPYGDIVTVYDQGDVDTPMYHWVVTKDARGNVGYAADRYLEVVRVTPLPTPAPSPYVMGIDVSENQTALDWQAVKAGGVSFALIRATQGIATSLPVGRDRRFIMHMEGAFAAGLSVGVYHAYLPDADGAAQAHFFMETVRPYLSRLSFPLALDVEIENGQDKATISGRLFDMASTLEALGAGLPMIYTGKFFWDDRILTRVDGYFSRCKLWLAQYNNAPQPTLPRTWKAQGWHIWQWRVDDDGIPGYPKRIDLDRMKV